MASLQIDPDAVRALCDQLDAQAGSFGECVTSIRGTNQQLNDDWDGPEMVAYTKTVGEQAQVMDRMCETIGECSQFLRKMANSYEAWAQEGQKAASGSGN